MALVDRRVRRAGEVVRLEHRGDADDRVPVDQEAAEHGLLGVDILWREAAR